MKKVLLGLAIVIGLASTTTYAQKTGKIGYCNVDYVLAYLPDTKQAESTVGTYKKQLDAMMQEKVAVFQTKYQAYEKGAATMTEFIRKEKESELQKMNADIENFSKQAEEDLQRKQVAVMEPVFAKINNAIKDVALENNYVFVLNANSSGLSIVLYAPDENNVSDLILKKLGVTPPAK